MSSPFLHPFQFYDFSTDRDLAWTVYDWEIFELSKAIRAKPDWKSKLANPEIVEKWINEAKLQLRPEHVDDTIKYALKEVQWYRKLESNLEGFHCGVDFKIVYTDQIDAPIRSNLVKNAEKLTASFKELDYHPNSNNQVVDLVHPSLFPVILGKTKVETSNGLEVYNPSKETLKAVKPKVEFGHDTKFQWLPALMKITDGKFHFESYINNLEPHEFKELYGVIEEVLDACLPGVEHVLGAFASAEYRRIPLPKTIEDVDPTKRFDYEKSMWEQLAPLEIEFHEPEIKPFSLTKFGALKVIVKMADIVLTPENPVYKGGSWHVEGTISEDIVATILYYYDIKNITESNLSYKIGLSEPLYEQGDKEFCKKMYNLVDGEPIPNDLGHQTAKEGRAVIFPNIYQHHVDPFELEDDSKPGHRRLLCMFIVDPYNKQTVASDKVPPQQEEWKGKFDFAAVGETFSLEEAKTVRDKLIVERKVKDPYESKYAADFSLCEH